MRNRLFALLNCLRLFASGRVGVAMLLGLLGPALMPHSAGAQNLVQNPNFTDGLNGYTACCNVTTSSDFGGVTAAILPAGSTLTQSIATTPDTLYTISFLATFNPGFYSVTFGSGSFSHLGGEGECCAFSPFSFTGTATGTTTDLTFFDNADTQGERLTGLDVEGPPGAPAPVAGAGGLSLLAWAAFLGGKLVWRNRRSSAA